MRGKIKRRDSFYVYILECKDKTYYTGYTNNIEARIKLHNSGKGAKYTKDRRPVKLTWVKKYKYFKRAFMKELEIKRMSRKKKEELVNSYLKISVG
ncbi:MAG: GIY-YIG nuclease family protein [Candidatus Kaelpia imicola]|nr:GIY-YIG nuclease family protein [Candidatus Kaelpia imicola]